MDPNANVANAAMASLDEDEQWYQQIANPDDHHAVIVASEKANGGNGSAPAAMMREKRTTRERAAGLSFGAKGNSMPPPGRTREGGHNDQGSAWEEEDLGGPDYNASGRPDALLDANGKTELKPTVGSVDFLINHDSTITSPIRMSEISTIATTESEPNTPPPYESANGGKNSGTKGKNANYDHDRAGRNTVADNATNVPGKDLPEKSLEEDNMQEKSSQENNMQERALEEPKTQPNEHADTAKLTGELLENLAVPVTDDGLVSLLRGRLFQMLQSTRSPDTFPGSQPVSFSQKHLDLLERDDYYVCEKSDGLRYLLYYCTPPWGPTAFLIDRNYRFREIAELTLPLRRLQGHHDETLLDGELLCEEHKDDEGNVKPKLIFLIFDMLMFNTKNVMRQTLPERLKIVQNDVITPLKELLSIRKGQFPPGTELYPFDLEIKQMFKPYALSDLFSHVIPGLKHENDGLIFTPVHDPYESGTCHRLLKWKPASLNTVDFKVVAVPLERSSSDGKGGGAASKPLYRWEIHVGHRRVHEFYDNLYLEADVDAEWQANPPIGRIIECRHDPDWHAKAAPASSNGGWRFLRFRDDKLAANDISVVDKILASIKDNVTQEALLARVPKILANWRMREKSTQPSRDGAPKAPPSSSNGFGEKRRIDGSSDGGRMSNPSFPVEDQPVAKASPAQRPRLA